jgi:hypothetical protein
MRTPRHFNTRLVPILRPTVNISAALPSSEGSSDQMENWILLVFWRLSIGAAAWDREMPRSLMRCGFFTTVPIT